MLDIVYLGFIYNIVMSGLFYNENPAPLVMPDILYRASILVFFRWIPADYLRG